MSYSINRPRKAGDKARPSEIWRVRVEEKSVRLEPAEVTEKELSWHVQLADTWGTGLMMAMPQ